MKKSIRFAEENKLQFIPYESLPFLADSADIIIVSTQASQPTVLPEYIITEKQRIFLDLSIPSNVHPDIKNISQQQIVNVDDISVDP